MKRYAHAVKQRLSCTRGTVSVYLIVLILPIFLLNALFIDLIRLRLAGRETEMAAKAGVRSVMSRFDASLQSYGLYGLVYDKGKLEEEFRQVAGNNLSSSVTESTFHYLDNPLVPDHSGLQDMYTLANSVEFKRQIVQEMKYRAPITYTLELAEPFKRSGTSKAMSTAAQFYDNASKLEDVAEKRDDALDEAWTQAQQLVRMAEGFSNKYEARIEHMNELADRIGLSTLDGIKNKIKEIGNTLERARNNLDSLNKLLKNKKRSLSEARRDGVRDVSNLEQDIEDLRDEINELNDEISKLIQEKQTWDQRLTDLLEYLALSEMCKSESTADAERLDSLYKTLTKKLDEAQTADNELSAELDRIRADKPNQSAYLPDELYNGIAPYGLVYFSKYRLETSKIVAAFQAIKTRWAALETFQISSLDDLSADLSNMRTLSQNFLATQGAEEMKRMNKIGEQKREKQNAQQKVNAALNTARNTVHTCSVNGSDPYVALYKQLEGDGSSDKGLYGKYWSYQEGNGESTATTAYTIEDDKKTPKSAMSLLNKISDALESFRDELYTNEFALSKFNYRTIGMPAGSPSSSELSQPESHPLAGQEAEYMLYGLNSCAKNQSAAFGEMFVLMLGIRTTEALMEPKSLGLSAAATPIVTFLAAAAEGAYQATLDMSKLTKGESVAVFKKIQSFTVNYKQLLRLFYLIHSRDAPMMARMQALLELNTGKDLTRMVTSVQGKITTSANLWFLPGLIKWFPEQNLGGRLSGKRWQIVRTAVFAYD